MASSRLINPLPVEKQIELTLSVSEAYSLRSLLARNRYATDSTDSLNYYSIESAIRRVM